MLLPSTRADISSSQRRSVLAQGYGSLIPLLNISVGSPTAANPPAATVQKIVSEILPASTGIAFSKDARDLLIECCVEFITLISSEANEISEREAKKTIGCDHITKALETLGFGEYVAAVVEAAAEHKEVQKVCCTTFLPRLRPQLLILVQGREKKSNKFEQSGLSLEELERMQAEQFAAAAARHT